MSSRDEVAGRRGGRRTADEATTRVLFVTAVDLAGASGANMATRFIVQALGNLEAVEVTLLAPVPSDGSDLLSELPVTDWWRLPPRARRSLGWHLKTAFRVWRNCRRLIQEKEPDVVAVRFQTYFLLSTLLFPRRDCRLVLLIRGRMDLGARGFPFGVVGAINRRLGLAAASRADRLLFAFRDAVGRLEDRVPSERIRIVPNGADVTSFPEVSRADARRKLREGKGLQLDGKIVGFAGSLRPRHCLEELFRASSLLHRRGTRHRLLVVGDGPMRSRLEALAREMDIEDYVHFAGRVSHERVGGYLAASDLLYGVVDPDRPSNPIKVYEALASGRPVVTSRRSELRFVEEEGFGVVVSSKDPEVIAASLDEGLAMDWSEPQASRARAYIEEHHSWTTVAREVVAT